MPQERAKLKKRLGAMLGQCQKNSPSSSDGWGPCWGNAEAMPKEQTKLNKRLGAMPGKSQKSGWLELEGRLGNGEAARKE